MRTDLKGIFEQIDIKDYVEEYPITTSNVAYRRADSPFEASGQEGRMNPSGTNCFYFADSIETAQHEIHFKYDNRTLYNIQPGSILLFNAGRFANDNSLMHLLTGSKEDGAYEFCQKLATYVTESCGITGVAYPSRQMALNGHTGMCIALLPQHWQLENNELRIFVDPVPAPGTPSP